MQTPDTHLLNNFGPRKYIRSTRADKRSTQANGSGNGQQQEARRQQGRGNSGKHGDQSGTTPDGKAHKRQRRSPATEATDGSNKDAS